MRACCSASIQGRYFSVRRGSVVPKGVGVRVACVWGMEEWSLPPERKLLTNEQQTMRPHGAPGQGKGMKATSAQIESTPALALVAE